MKNFLLALLFVTAITVGFGGFYAVPLLLALVLPIGWAIGIGWFVWATIIVWTCLQLS